MLKKLVNEEFILSIIVLNAVILFLVSFEHINKAYPILNYIDLGVSVVFILEMLAKIKLTSWKEYYKDSWNKLDLMINICILPSFFFFYTGQENLLFLTVLRLGRVFKFFKVLKFIPNIEHLLRGIQRAMRASVFVVFAFFVYMFIVAILSCFFYKNILPDYFGDPLLSLYSTFKIFTIEGWYEIPDLIAQNSTETVSFFSKIYFIFLLLTGGVCGLSLVNAIFVDELVADNNDALEKKVDSLQVENKVLNEKLDKILEKIDDK